MRRKAAELGAIGAASGAAMSLGGSAALAVRRRSDPAFQPSVPVPELGRSTQGMGLSLGAFSNLRYQAVSGIDRVLFERGPWLWANLVATTAFRAGAHLVAQPTRLFLQVLPPAPACAGQLPPAFHGSCLRSCMPSCVLARSWQGVQPPPVLLLPGMPEVTRRMLTRTCRAQGLPTSIPQSRRAAEQQRKAEAVARLVQLRAQFAARQRQASHPQYVEVDMPASAV